MAEALAGPAALAGTGQGPFRQAGGGKAPEELGKPKQHGVKAAAAGGKAPPPPKHPGSSSIGAIGRESKITAASADKTSLLVTPSLPLLYPCRQRQKQALM